MRRLHEASAVVENLDEGPVLYMLTWFAHGGYQLQCREPRVLRLDRFWHHWLADLRELWKLWNDRLDPNALASIGIVHPEPPIATGRYHEGHMVIHQRTDDAPGC